MDVLMFVRTASPGSGRGGKRGRGRRRNRGTQGLHAVIGARPDRWEELKDDVQDPSMTRHASKAMNSSGAARIPRAVTEREQRAAESKRLDDALREANAKLEAELARVRAATVTEREQLAAESERLDAALRETNAKLEAELARVRAEMVGTAVPPFRLGHAS